MNIIQELQNTFGEAAVAPQATKDDIPTFWTTKERLPEILRFLKSGTQSPYPMLYDLSAIDERVRGNRQDQPASDFTLVYHLLSFERNQDVRVKVALAGEHPSIPSITPLWKSADWYECEIWDMFGIRAEGHPHLRRILMPPDWKGHPLRKEHPARRTELGKFRLADDREVKEEDAMRFRPEDWGLSPRQDGTDFMFLNLGPHHTGTHGVLRIILELDGERIENAILDIGFHHRAQEKTAERQTWHTYIPYTDRIDYLAGVLNEFPYVLAVEKLAGIEVPDRAKVIRVMLAELFRIANHLVWYGTFAADLGQLSPVFFTFNDRERFYTIIEAVCGFRMHPGWFRIGGVAADLPRGWEKLVRDFLDYMPARLREYDRIVMQNRIVKARTQGVGALTRDQAIEWGVTGPNLRACGFEWDFRKKRPYSGYDQFEFDIPTATHGDSYDRAAVRVEEMRQSLRIVEQCLKNMPAGNTKADHPLATPPRKDRTMLDIETLIDHFLNVSWGPVVPAGEAAFGIEAAKGNMSYYLISDGSTQSYRARIRTPSFPHLQAVPEMTRGLNISDLIAILGSIDFIMGDVDR
ncbi:MAG: NADH-quinone oxidoreductase subunit C/D [Nitrospirae bacterium GWC2_57_9]|nr:MAG: NADH-quinone oxidoreductase subunit C/D [Nitrospirae bacterium GWC2_57_9]